MYVFIEKQEKLYLNYPCYPYVELWTHQGAVEKLKWEE